MRVTPRDIWLTTPLSTENNCPEGYLGQNCYILDRHDYHGGRRFLHVFHCPWPAHSAPAEAGQNFELLSSFSKVP